MESGEWFQEAENCKHVKEMNGQMILQGCDKIWETSNDV